MECYKPYVACKKIDPKEEIKRLQYLMVYDDADSNWGHRDNILDKWHNKVNIGIAYDDYLAFVQHFENDYIDWDRYQITDSNLMLSGRIGLEGVKPSYIAIYYDPLPKSMSREELLNTPDCYTYGGGITCNVNDIDEYTIDIIYPPPEEGYYYEEPVKVADKWILSSNYFYIESNLSLAKEGVYTLVLFGEKDSEYIPLMSHSLFIR